MLRLLYIFITGVCALSVLSGCLATTHSSVSAFDPVQAAYIHESGTARIEGEAFMKTIGGDVKTAAGNIIALIPATDYANERIAKLYKGKRYTTDVAQKFKHTDSRYNEFSKTVKADSRGAFAFENIKAGEYYVIAIVQWGVASGSYISRQGASLKERITVRKGETVKLIMSAP